MQKIQILNFGSAAISETTSEANLKCAKTFSNEKSVGLNSGSNFSKYNAKLFAVQFIDEVTKDSVMFRS